MLGEQGSKQDRKTAAFIKLSLLGKTENKQVKFISEKVSGLMKSINQVYKMERGWEGGQGGPLCGGDLGAETEMVRGANYGKSLERGGGWALAVTEAAGVAGVREAR